MCDISNYLHNIENIIIFNNENVILTKYIKFTLNIIQSRLLLIMIIEIIFVLERQ